jgi:hypothetical protein
MMLPLVILLPLIGAILLASSPKMGAKSAGRIAGIFALLPLFVARPIGEWSLPWMPDADIALRFSMDGLSYLFVLLVALVTLVAILSSILKGKGDRGYYALILVLQAALFGVFTAHDPRLHDAGRRLLLVRDMGLEAAQAPVFGCVRLASGANWRGNRERCKGKCQAAFHQGHSRLLLMSELVSCDRCLGPICSITAG